MTTIWQPPVRDIDPLMSLVVEAIRSQLFPIMPVSVVIDSVPGTAWREARLDDGRRVRMALSLTPGDQARWAARACAGFGVSGQVAVDDIGYRATGSVVVDLKTQAVLSCDCRLESVGRVGV